MVYPFDNVHIWISATAPNKSIGIYFEWFSLFNIKTVFIHI